MYPPQIRSFERRICSQTQDLQIFKKFHMSQMNPKEVFHNIAYSAQDSGSLYYTIVGLLLFQDPTPIICRFYNPPYGISSSIISY